MKRIEQEGAQESRDVSRRSFLKGASFVTLGAMGMLATGCSPQGDSNASNASAGTSDGESAATTDDITWMVRSDSPVWDIGEIGEPTETIPADVVIVGAGSAGMTASIQAKQLGLEPVLLEKRNAIGGNSFGCEGYFAVGSSLQKEMGLEYDQAELVNEVLSYHHNMIDPQLLTNFVAHTGENIDWMIEQGIVFERVINGHSPNRTVWHIAQGGEKPGPYVSQKMQDAVADNKVDTQVETPAKSIVLDEEGKVAGVIAQRSDGSFVEYATKAVLICTGGYGSSPEFMEYYCNLKPEQWYPFGMDGHDGDGFRLAHAINGEMWHYPATKMSGSTPVAFSFGTLEFAGATQEYGLSINDKGERYCDNVPQSGKCWTVMAQNAIDELEFGAGCLFGNGVFAFTGEKMSGLNETFEAAQDGETVIKADTVAELAKKMGVDAEALQGTIDRYNGFCANGVDEDFLRNPSALLALAGPYWAFATSIGVFFTCNGLRINRENQVLDTNLEAIPGLYCAGNDTGGLYAHTYDITVMPGSQGAWAIHSGRNAMKDIAKYLKA